MRYFKDDVIYDGCEIKKLVYPATLPKNWLPEHIASKGFLPVTETEKPAITNLQLIQDDGVKLVDDIPTQIWTVINKFETKEEETTFLDEIEAKRLLAIEQAEEAELKRISDLALAKLEKLDLKSIRSIREYILTKEDAPKYLVDYESEAIDERLKVKK